MIVARIREHLTAMSRGNCIVLLLLVLLVFLSTCLMPTEAFSVVQQPYDRYEIEEPPETAGDVYVEMAKRYYRGWGHRTRFPWKRLPRNMCYRQPCKKDKDCCRSYNICDLSVKVCRDCWYAAECKSEADCCEKFPYCMRIWGRTPSGQRYLRRGKCVHKL